MATRRCSCKKSECLKLYCECLAAGLSCGDSCVCIACKNKGDGESASSSPATGFHPAKKFVPRADVAPPPPPKIGEMQTGNTVGGLTAAVELSTARSATGGDPSSNAAIPVIRLQIPSALGPKLAPVPCDCISGFCHEACACARLESCIPECACGGTCRAKKERIILTTTATRENKGTTTRDKPKGCSCKKSHCLKLYCECLAANRMCGEHCNCHNCKNFPGCEEDRDRAIENILERNPMAFQPKVANGTSQHLRGCNCRKSGCTKNYCECFQAGVPCTSRCACLQCGNKSTTSLPGDIAMDPEVRIRRQRQQQRRLVIEQRSKGGGKTSRKLPNNFALPSQQATTIAPSPSDSPGARPLSALEMLSQTVPSSSGTMKPDSMKSVPVSKRPHMPSNSLGKQPSQAHLKRNSVSKSSVQQSTAAGVSVVIPTDGVASAALNGSVELPMGLPDLKRVLATAYYRKDSKKVGNTTPKEAAARSSTVSMLCQSLIAAAQSISSDAEYSTSSEGISQSSVWHDVSSPMHVDREDDAVMQDSETNYERTRDGSLSPGATGLLCDEDMERDDDDEQENVQGREKRARLAAAQERAVLQEFSVWLRNMTASPDQVE